jgi:hypothetical protein
MAVTYDVTPANGGANAIGTLETTAQLQGYVITVMSTSNGDDTAVDLSTNDGASGSLYDLMLRELSPMLAYAPNSGDKNVISVIMDGHHNTAASIAARIEALDGVGTDTTVAAAASITVA